MPRHCLIALQTPLVAQDLALTLQDLTGSTPILAETLTDAFEKLAATVGAQPIPPGGLSCAVLQTDAAGLCADPISARLKDLGAPVVLLGHAAEMEAAQGGGRPDWPVLAQPFGPAQVAEALQRAGALAMPAGGPNTGAAQHSSPAP